MGGVLAVEGEGWGGVLAVQGGVGWGLSSAG